MSEQHRLRSACARVSDLLGDSDATVSVPALDDVALLGGLKAIAEARKALDLLTAVFTAEIDVRSARELGYTGLAQRNGHRTATDLVQHVTGQSRTDVVKATRAGRDLAAVQPTAPVPTGRGERAVWFAPLTAALRGQALSREQFDAIRRGLGEPPLDRYPSTDSDLVVAAWSEAAATLIEEAGRVCVEDLAAAARLARDTLDPVGTALRFEERFADRSFAMWTDGSGQQHAKMRFDDESAAWVRTILNAALRPRRGPRFVDPDASAAIPDGVGDERSTQQLQYDTIMAVLRTGAQADPARAFGDRQPGIRIVTTADAVSRDADSGAMRGIGVCEDTGQALPGFVLETYLCDAATQPVYIDANRSPLDVGRERRLFTAKQRAALAVRDGGCLWCGAEPSRCEAHHIDHWAADRGRTDVADGVLLCRNCHMRLHNQRRRILRRDHTYWLTAPPGAGGRPESPPRRLKPQSLLRFARPPHEAFSRVREDERDARWRAGGRT